VVYELTSDCCYTRIVCALIFIVALDLQTADALASHTNVAGRAEIVVVAFNRVWNTHAPLRRVARIVRAGIPIVAVYQRATGTDSAGALVVERASIIVVAEEALVVRDEGTLPSSRVAVWL
jgi:NAD/NADP transhydrogenase alpha subunit